MGLVKKGFERDVNGRGNASAKFAVVGENGVEMAARRPREPFSGKIDAKRANPVE